MVNCVLLMPSFKGDFLKFLLRLRLVLDEPLPF